MTIFKKQIKTPLGISLRESINSSDDSNKVISIFSLYKLTNDKRAY